MATVLISSSLEHPFIMPLTVAASPSQNVIHPLFKLDGILLLSGDTTMKGLGSRTPFATSPIACSLREYGWV